ncbi:MAG: heat-inducible transcription repressor, heat-inducible transcriptional repressor [Candidatus Peregrinibacteria bacterium GW2011_GWC2_39_14]|nr:MAG: Transcriptional regulator of heat shock protein [Candidatus Peregrinibacteria bacterium GW2011_GWA2_38_36]KKR06887.1 MAG: heat-inducible transcription repressor, heat-inducible transcriptional repressor [Candidatus Peregrinibacteria bacterium GW2011_GWC2_39_14]
MDFGNRKISILKAIVQRFIETAEPVGSNIIIVQYHLNVSPATVRNDMAELEEEGFIFQPHTSAGRVPTQQGYRKYVEEIADYDSARKRVEKALIPMREEYKIQKTKEKLHEAVHLLSRATHNVSFATLPDNQRTFYLGVSNALRQPEFINDPVSASQVMEVLEENDNFIKILKSLEIGEKADVFIGQENIIPQIHSCSIIVTKYELDGFEGFLGILGPMRMDYPYNMVLVEEIKKLLRNK